MSRTERFQGQSHDGAKLTAVYLEDNDTNIAFGLVSGDDELPRIVHWGRPLAHPETLLNAYDALKPQRVSGALDETPWPSIMPTQAESWIGEPRLVVRRGSVELFPKFTVTDVNTDAEQSGTVDATMDFNPSKGPEDIADAAGVARTTGARTVPGVTVTASDAELGIELVWHAQIVPGGLVRQRATVRNLFDDHAAPLEIGTVELGFPLPEIASEILTTTGPTAPATHRWTL